MCRLALGIWVREFVAKPQCHTRAAKTKEIIHLARSVHFPGVAFVEDEKHEVRAHDGGSPFATCEHKRILLAKDLLCW